VQRILRPYMQLSTGQLFGLQPQLQQIRAALSMGSGQPGQGVRLHGLYGLGGIGKSTLAQRFYEESKSQFVRHAFVHVGQDVTSGSALISKQQELLQRISSHAAAASGDMELRSALCRSFESGGRLLLVLDDLWAEQQLAALLGCEPNSAVRLHAGQWSSGSRVLIIARNKTVVSNRLSGAHKPQPEPQQVQPLPDPAAQQLLHLHAFEQAMQPPGFTDQHINAAMAICGGLPLTLRLLGGALQRLQTPVAWQVYLCLTAFRPPPSEEHDVF
jgi:NB-ARC domain